MSALPRFCLGDALALAQKALRTSVEVLFERRPSGAGLDIERLLLIRYLPSGSSWITSLVARAVLAIDEVSNTVYPW
jgi:hypothetical protein